MENRKIGSVLKHYRKQKKMSQQDVADRLGCNRASYTYYETGKVTPNVYTLVKLTKIFEVPPIPFFTEIIEEVECVLQKQEQEKQ